MSEEIIHPHYEQFLQHQEAAAEERAEALKTFKTGIERLAAEGRLEEQFSPEEAAQILAELGEPAPEEPVEATTFPPEGEVFTTSSPEVSVPVEEIPAEVAEVEVTPEEIQADLEHGTDDAPAEPADEPSEEPAEETPAEEPEAKEEPVEEKPAPKKRTTKAKAKKTEE